jgi:hypothetical protein
VVFSNAGEKVPPGAVDACSRRFLAVLRVWQGLRASPPTRNLCMPSDGSVTRSARQWALS